MSSIRRPYPIAAFASRRRAVLLGIGAMLALVVANIIVSPAMAWWDPYRRTTIGGMMFQNAQTALNQAMGMREEASQFNAEIAAAREEYWNAYPSRVDHSKLEGKFSELLREKRLYYLIEDLPEGAEGEHAKFLNMVTRTIDIAAPRVLCSGSCPLDFSNQFRTWHQTFQPQDAALAGLAGLSDYLRCKSRGCQRPSRKMGDRYRGERQLVANAATHRNRWIRSNLRI
jgi:hypothetical protein